jgi:4-hydroxy-4-methyl-2-oxoglutarate aldolase
MTAYDGSLFPQLPTALLSDALDRLGRSGSLLGIAPLANGQRIMGPAYTVRYISAGHPPGTVGDYLDDVDAGSVVVLDNGGRLDCTVWGDILTAVAHQRGVGGTVIDGVNRDVQRALETGYSIWSRGRFMRTGKDRVEVSGVQCAVSVSGVQVRPGDLVVGDDDGVLVIPDDLVTDVFEVASTVSEVEEHILHDALAGVPLREARAKHGYHTLQRRTR